MGDIVPFVLDPPASTLPGSDSHPRRRENKWSDRPPRHKCGICWFPVNPREAVAEERTTGDNDRPEQWLYCAACWDEMLAIRKLSANTDSPDPAGDFEPAFNTTLRHATPPANGACSRLARFLANQLNLDSKLKFLLHLDHCMRCWEQVYQATKAQHRHCYEPFGASHAPPPGNTPPPSPPAVTRQASATSFF